MVHGNDETDREKDFLFVPFGTGLQEPLEDSLQQSSVSVSRYKES